MCKLAYGTVIRANTPLVRSRPAMWISFVCALPRLYWLVMAAEAAVIALFPAIIDFNIHSSYEVPCCSS